MTEFKVINVDDPISTLYLYSTLKFGKYKGRKVNEVIKEDKTYIKWFIKIFGGIIDKKIYEELNRNDS